jgi:hypothetical protein
MDLSRLSDEDFQALAKGNLAGMSEQGFAQLVKVQEATKPMAEKVARTTERMRAEVNPVAGQNFAQNAAQGLGKMLSDTGLAVRQALPGSSVTRAEVDERQARDAPLMGTWGGKLGNVAPKMAAGMGATMLPGMQGIGGAMLSSAAVGLADPVGTNDSALKNALVSAGGGLAGYGLAKGTANVLAPQVPADAQRLTAAGIYMTPGQRLGGAAKRAEDAMTSLPVMGDVIKSAQRKSFEGFNAAVANRALAPIKGKLPEGVTGREAVAYVESSLGKAYESALGRVKAVQADGQFASELQNLRNMVRSSPMPPEVKGQFDAVITNQIAGKLQGQSAMTGQTFKQVESEIGRLAARYGADASADRQLLGDALQETQAAMRRWLERAAGPDVAADVKAANAGWAEFKRMQRASSFLGAEDGVFSPANYQNAVKALDKSKDKGAFARGGALGQDLASDAVRLLGPKVPDSGTPFRTLVNEPLKGAASTLLMGLPVGAAYGFAPTRNALNLLMNAPRPALATKAAAELRLMAPATTAFGSNVGTNAFGPAIGNALMPIAP